MPSIYTLFCFFRSQPCVVILIGILNVETICLLVDTVDVLVDVL